MRLALLPLGLLTIWITGCAAPLTPSLHSLAPIPMTIQGRMVMAADPAGTAAWNLLQIDKTARTVQGTGGAKTVVAVLDTGVDPHQPVLAGVTYPLIDVVGQDVYSGSGTTADFTGRDGNGHGTHVAGIVAQVAAGANVRILPIKVIPNSGTGDDHLLSAGIEKALAWRDPNDPSVRVRVMNLSVSSPLVSQLLTRTIREATAAGVLVVAATGNDASAVEFPAQMPEVLAVGATTVEDQVADYSCYGDQVAVAAPGGSDETPVFSTWPTYLTSSDLDAQISTPHPKAGLVGTSMATPHVAGTAAVLWTQQPSMTAQQVRERILALADNLNGQAPSPYFGYGRLNYERALTEVGADAY